MYKAKLLDSEITSTQTLASTRLRYMSAFSVQVNSTVTTPSAKTFDSEAAATLEVQDLTYTADAAGAAGNSITIEYTDGATAGAEVVTVVGNAISVQIQSGVSTATEVKTAVDASAAASALISVAITGTAGDAQVTAAATPLAGGRTSEVETPGAANTVTIPSHGYVTGLKGQLTTTGTLPAGLSLATDYFIIVVSASAVSFAASLSDALAGTAVAITDEGTGVHTFTATALAGGNIKVQGSNDDVNFVDISGATANITATGSVLVNVVDPAYKYARPVLTMTAGQLDTEVIFVGKDSFLNV